MGLLLTIIVPTRPVVQVIIIAVRRLVDIIIVMKGNRILAIQVVANFIIAMMAMEVPILHLLILGGVVVKNIGKLHAIVIIGDIIVRVVTLLVIVLIVELLLTHVKQVAVELEAIIVAEFHLAV